MKTTILILLLAGSVFGAETNKPANPPVAQDQAVLLRIQIAAIVKQEQANGEAARRLEVIANSKGAAKQPNAAERNTIRDLAKQRKDLSTQRAGLEVKYLTLKGGTKEAQDELAFITHRINEAEFKRRQAKRK